MVISSGTKTGQTIVIGLFGFIYLLLSIAYLQSGNLNYLLIIVVSLILFLPVFLYTIKFYDITIEENDFVISNLFVKKRINASLFSDILPAKNVLPILNSPYFSIHFSNNEKYNFVKKRLLSETFQSRSFISKKITKDILDYLNKIRSQNNV
jgi:hypothetical protein